MKAGVEAPAAVQAEIVRLYEAGVPRRQIISTVGCGNGAISTALKRHGVEPRKGRKQGAPEKDAEVVRLYLAGVSRKEIVATTGVPNGTISHILKRNGVDRERARRAPVAPEMVAAVEKLYLSGKSYTEIGAALGISHGSVAGLVHRKQMKRSPEFAAANLKRAALSRPQREKSEPKPRPKLVAVVSRDETRVLMVPETEAGKYVARHAAPQMLAAGEDPIPQLRPLDCRWPIGEVGEPGFRFCCRIATRAYRGDGHPLYCDEHGKIAFRPPSRSEKDSISIGKWR